MVRRGESVVGASRWKGGGVLWIDPSLSFGRITAVVVAGGFEGRIDVVVVVVVVVVVIWPWAVNLAEHRVHGDIFVVQNIALAGMFRACDDEMANNNRQAPVCAHQLRSRYRGPLLPYCVRRTLLQWLEWIRTRWTEWAASLCKDNTRSGTRTSHRQTEKVSRDRDRPATCSPSFCFRASTGAEKKLEPIGKIQVWV